MNFIIALIESLRGASGEGGWTDGYHCALSDVKSVLENALSDKRETTKFKAVQPLDPELLVKNSDTLTEIQCSHCGRWMVEITGRTDPTFCPHCGCLFHR